MVAPRMQNMSSQSIKISLLVALLLIMSTPVFAVDCKSIRSAYLKERHRCISLFREAYAPEKQPSSGDIQMTDVGVNMCFATLNSDYPEFADGGECVGVEEEYIDKKFEGYVQKCLHQSNFSECEKILNNVKSVDNVRNSDGATLLMIAAQEGDLNAMDFLLQKGASARKVNHYARTLLHYAVTPKIEKFDGCNDTNEVILNVVQKVLDLGVQPQELSLSGWNALFSAMNKDLSSNVVELLLNAGANPNLRCLVGKEQIAPILKAIARNDLEKVQLLLKAGANPNMKSLFVSENGRSWEDPLLITAINNSNVEIVKVLVNAGANVNTVSDGMEINFSPLEWAEHCAKENLGCECNDEICKERCDAAIAKDEIVVFLKKAGATKVFSYGRSFIEYCWLLDLTETMVYDAIKQGADVNETDSVGWTPLHGVAAKGKNPKAMMALIKKGAFVNAMTKKGSTPLLAAAEYNPNPAFVKILINAGADINVKGPERKNALELAVAFNSPEVVESLLKTKLGTNLSDEEKCWLIQSAIRDNPNPDVLKVLFRNGFNAKPRSAIFGLVNFNPLATALSKGKEIETIKLILQNGGVVDNECMRLARDLPMDTPEQRKYRNQMIDLLTRHKK